MAGPQLIGEPEELPGVIAQDHPHLFLRYPGADHPSELVSRIEHRHVRAVEYPVRPDPLDHLFKGGSISADAV